MNGIIILFIFNKMFESIENKWMEFQLSIANAHNHQMSIKFQRAYNRTILSGVEIKNEMVLFFPVSYGSINK